jgi:hypothetical protein
VFAESVCVAVVSEPDNAFPLLILVEWGGQLELQAIARAYGVEINVVQKDGRMEKIESGEFAESVCVAVVSEPDNAFPLLILVEAVVVARFDLLSY